MSAAALPLTRRRPRPGPFAGSLLVLALASAASMVLGPAGVDPWGAILEVLDRLPLVSVDSGLSEQEAAIVWELRMPRLVLGGLVGATLARSATSWAALRSRALFIRCQSSLKRTPWMPPGKGMSV